MNAGNRNGPTTKEKKMFKLFIYLLPLVLAGLAIFIVIVNLRHSATCATEGATEAALKRAALEKRLMALEQEVLENGILMEKFIRQLQEKYTEAHGISVSELRNIAHHRAETIGQRLGEEPAPPKPDFPAEELFQSMQQLGDGIDSGIQAMVEDRYDYNSGSEQMGGGGGGGGGGNDFSFEEDGKGKEYGYYDDDPFQSQKAGRDGTSNNNNAEAEKLTGAQLEGECHRMASEGGVVIGSSWGTLSKQDQATWHLYNCDFWVNGIE